MQGGRYKSNRQAKEKRQGGGHRGGNGNGNGRGHNGNGGGGNNNGNGIGGGGNDGGEDDPTTTATPAAAATTPEETTAAAAATPITTLTAKTTDEAPTPKTTLTPKITSSSTSSEESSDSTTVTAEQTTSSSSAGSEKTGSSTTALSGESSTWDLGTLATDTTAAQAFATETSSGTLSATSSASSSSTTSSSSSSRAGLIAGVIVGLGLLIALGLLVYRLRRTQHMQRVLALVPFRKDEDATPGPYQNMRDKSDGEMSQNMNMTGETLTAIHAMRAQGPASPKPPPKDTQGPGARNGTQLSLDTGFHFPARSSTVSPVSVVSELGPEVSPISPTSNRPPSHIPPPQPSLLSASRGSVTARSITGSEARIVSIPTRTSRTLSTDVVASGPPGGNFTGRGAPPDGIARKPVPNRMPEAPNRMPDAPRRWPYPDRPPSHGPGPMGPISYGGGGGGNGGAWRPPVPGQQSSRQPPRQAPRQPPRQRPMGPSDAVRAPPPLSINRSKQAPMWSAQQNATRPAADANNNGGYQPYNPSSGNDRTRGPPLNTNYSNRVSKGSVSGASMASSDVFSLTDAVSWPKPPSTPTVSPDRH